MLIASLGFTPPTMTKRQPVGREVAAMKIDQILALDARDGLLVAGEAVVIGVVVGIGQFVEGARGHPAGAVAPLLEVGEDFGADLLDVIFWESGAAQQIADDVHQQGQRGGQALGAEGADVRARAEAKARADGLHSFVQLIEGAALCATLHHIQRKTRQAVQIGGFVLRAGLDVAADHHRRAGEVLACQHGDAVGQRFSQGVIGAG